MAMNSDFWTFSIGLYGRPGVADACLGLQDRLGADVNLVLFAAWVGASGRALSEGEIQMSQNVVSAWRREVVEVLRLLRRRLKVGPAPAPSSQTDALRKAIKAAELSAEKIEQDALYELFTNRFPKKAPQDPVSATVQNIISVLSKHPLAGLDEPDTEWICTIVNATVPAASGPAVAAAVAREISARAMG